MNRKAFIEHLKKGDILFTKNDLKTILIEQMLMFIEKEIQFYELDELSELIYRYNKDKASQDVIDVVTQLHEIREDMHNPIKQQLTEEELIFKIDEFLVVLT